MIFSLRNFYTLSSEYLSKSYWKWFCVNCITFNCALTLKLEFVNEQTTNDLCR